MQKRMLLPLLAAFCLVLIAPTRAQVSFQFDYTYDDNNFFTGANAGRQTYLTAVGNYVANLIGATPLSAITPADGNTWDSQPFDPRNVAVSLNLGNITVAANTIIVYAGGYNLGGSTLGVGGPGGYGASGSPAWFDTLDYRGNGTFNMTSVGSITFNTTATWFFDNDIFTTEAFPGQSDFFSVAAHELIHLLGFGTNPTWNSLISGGNFTGTASTAAFGGPVPLSGDEGHWVEGTGSLLLQSAIAQEALMDPSITVGTRKYATVLDGAGLSDLGFVSAVPEPAAYALLFGIVTFLVAVRGRRAA